MEFMLILKFFNVTSIIIMLVFADDPKKKVARFAYGGFDCGIRTVFESFITWI